MTAKQVCYALFAMLIPALVCAQEPASELTPDPLSEAEAIVKAAGPLPIALKPAALLAAHDLLMEPTAWYYHTCRPGQFGSYRYDLFVLYPDETFVLFNSSFSADGFVEQQYASPDYFLSASNLRAYPEYSGKWKVGEDGKVQFTVTRISPNFKRRKDFSRDEFLTGWRRPSDRHYKGTALQSSRDQTSTYDLKKTTFYSNHFGKTAADVTKYLEPL